MNKPVSLALIFFSMLASKCFCVRSALAATAPGATPLAKISRWPDHPREGFRSVDVSGKRAVATGFSGVHILDFSDPSGPRRIASLTLPSGVSKSVTIGDYLLVFGFGLRVFDIHFPERPVPVGALTF